MKNILEVHGLRKNFETFILDDISFALPSGYVMGFIGPNGAGKTTTIKLILNINRSDSGSVKLFGHDSNIAANENIGIVMDTPMYADEWRISDIENAVMPFYSKWDKYQFAYHLQNFGLEPNKKVKELSRGMKVKLQIAAAISHGAKILILDEPTSGLDPVARSEICDILQDFVLDKSKSVLFSTHITSDLVKIADYITFILGGKVEYTGTRDDLLSKYTRITGDIADLDAMQKAMVIDYREHRTDFEGMIETSQIKKLPPNVLTETISLDEIIISMNKGVNMDE